jgi:hypothetical protein
MMKLLVIMELFLHGGQAQKPCDLNIHGETYGMWLKLFDVVFSIFYKMYMHACI